MKLAEIQDQLQRAIKDGDDAILGAVPDSPRESRRVLLDVYRNAYVLRLIEVIKNDFEQLAAFMSDTAFNEMARAYIQAHPSDQPNARHVARHLATFLASRSPYQEQPILAEYAALEAALNDAFDGPDARVLGIGDLAAVSPELWAQISFTPHPTVRRLDAFTNLAEIWAAVRAGEVPPEVAPRSEPQRFVAWRLATSTQFRVMGAEEAMMWDEAVKGVRFGRLCELVAVFDDPSTADLRAATYLKGWIDAEMLSAITLNE